MPAPAPTFPALLQRSVERHGDRPLFGVREIEGWDYLSYRAFATKVEACRAGLAATGVAHGDRVALLGTNSVAWAVTAYASYALGAALVPVYAALRPEDWQFILEDSGAKALICGSAPLFERTRPLVERLPDLEVHVGEGLAPDHPQAFSQLLARGRRSEGSPTPVVSDDVACFLYTSGTTGEPKGVMLTHRAQCQNVSAVLHSLPLSAEDRALSFLPWAHSFGQTCELHAMIALGASMAISRGPSHLVDDLREVRPTALVSVPRIFNRLYDDVHRRLRQRPGVLRRLFAEGRRLAAARREGPLSLRDRLSLEAADRAVFAPIRARFGGRLRYVFSGGAPLGNETRTLIDDLGIRVYEGYGLTEAGPVVTANRPEARRLGSVGRPLLGVSVRIDDERGPPGTGEICVKSPGVMRGYHRREAESAAAFDADGWLRTGDVGYLDEDGYLHLTGRLTEQYKLDSGLFVAPVPLEEELKRSAFIKNIMMYGEGRPHNVALVVVDLDALNRWAEQRELHFDSTATMLASRRVHDLVLAEIGERSRSHQAYERIKDVHLTDVDFTTDNGMLTPTGRVRRSNAFAAHAAALAALYPESGPP